MLVTAVALTPALLVGDVELDGANECLERVLHTIAHLPAPTAWPGVAQRGGAPAASGRTAMAKHDSANGHSP